MNNNTAENIRYFRTKNSDRPGQEARGPETGDPYFEDRAARRAIIRKKARQKTVDRIFTAIFLCDAVIVLGYLNLVNPVVVGPVIACVCVWLAFWLGAYAQFRFGKGGFLNVTIE